MDVANGRVTAVVAWWRVAGRLAVDGTANAVDR